MKTAVVCGPTASGKTRLAADLAYTFGGEVVNADSMQVYRGMDIASAMPEESEKRGIPHHLYGFLDPETPFSVADYLPQARRIIAEISDRGNLPIIAGGTGFYISSLIDGADFQGPNLDGPDPAFRDKMYKLAEEKGNSYLLEKLREVSPEAASRLHENNVKRVVRALEIAKSGKKDSRVFGEKTYDALVLGLDFADRQTLYARINRRVDVMLENGLLDEARRFFEKNSATSSQATSLQAIGHKEFFPYFEGVSALAECAETLKRRTRNYAKRQLTWFRRIPEVNWLIAESEQNYEKILQKASETIDKFLKT